MNVSLLIFEMSLETLNFKFTFPFFFTPKSLIIQFLNLVLSYRAFMHASHLLIIILLFSNIYLISYGVS